jgi:predicted esterase
MTLARQGAAAIALTIVLAYQSPREVVHAQAVSAPPREYAAAVNIPGENYHMRGVALLPAKASTVRSVIWIMHQGVMSEQLYYDPELRQVAADTNSAVVLASGAPIEFRTPRSASEETNRNAALGGSTGVSRLLEVFAEAMGRRELRRAPMLFWGFSASASFGTTYAALHPDRTIGFVRYHTRRRGIEVDLNKIKDIPALLLAGGNDQVAGVEDSEQFWKVGREAGAPWTLAIEPTAAHSSPEIHLDTMKNLTIPWIAGVLRHRVSDGRSLRPVSAESAFGADPHTFELAPLTSLVGRANNAVWLPDQRTAESWQKVVRGQK